MRRLRKKGRTQGTRLLKEYKEYCRKTLGVRLPSHHWEFRDLSVKLGPTFGRMRGLWRCHWLLSDALQHADVNDREQLLGLLVQSLKCLHQVALDGGSWDAASLMLPEEEPGYRAPFGGNERELEVIYKYRKNLAELRGRSRFRPPEGGGGGGAGGAGGPGGGAQTGEGEGDDNGGDGQEAAAGGGAAAKGKARQRRR